MTTIEGEAKTIVEIETLDPPDPTSCEFAPRNAEQPDRFILANGTEHRAVVLLSGDFTAMTIEILTGLAGGAWKALTQREPTREQAEHIARSWVTCYSAYERRRNPRQIILPHGATLQ
jgi:hypothetical protein